VTASFGCHVLAAATAIAAPALAPWALAAVLLNHVVITAAGLTPRSRLLGPNVSRLPAAAVARGEIALTFDDGPDPLVTPQLLDLLDAHGVHASFFCIAERVQAYPALARDIVARGHSIENHTARHRHNFSFLGPRGYAAELHRAQELIAQVTGRLPTCFRAPAGFRNMFLAPALQRQGLALVSWTRRGFDTREADASKVLERLSRGLAGGDILLLHDGHAARTAAGQPVLLDVLPSLLARIRHAGLRCVTLPAALRQEEART
jgi:peptidoglycan/xylan/chitin deacetylase (PgdA/CDA1 family)